MPSIQALPPKICTLIIDEADAFFSENEDLRGIINSGHTRPTAYVIRTVGDDHEPKKFTTWAFKAIAGIANERRQSRIKALASPSSENSPARRSSALLGVGQCRCGRRGEARPARVLERQAAG